MFEPVNSDKVTSTAEPVTIQMRLELTKAIIIGSWFFIVYPVIFSI